MSARKLLAAAWQHCRLLLALAAGLFFGYRFMTGESTNLWITPPACIVAFLGGGLNLVAVILNRGKMPVRIIEIPDRYKNSHEPVHGKTRVRLLGDWIYFGGRYHSPGDICMYIGVAAVATDQL